VSGLGRLEEPALGPKGCAGGGQPHSPGKRLPQDTPVPEAPARSALRQPWSVVDPRRRRRTTPRSIGCRSNSWRRLGAPRGGVPRRGSRAPARARMPGPPVAGHHASRHPARGHMKVSLTSQARTSTGGRLAAREEERAVGATLPRVHAARLHGRGGRIQRFAEPPELEHRPLSAVNSGRSCAHA
jgi:hypothetical protein